MDAELIYEETTMASLNKVQLIGNLGRDAELRYTPAGAAVASINMATTEVWNDKAGQKQEKTEWHRVVIWGKMAESLAEYLVKGKQIYVEGRLQTKSWEKDGVTRYATDVRADRVLLLGGGQKKDAGHGAPHPADAETAAVGASTQAGAPVDDDDIPF